MNAQVRYMLARTQSMFKYENLPSTIPQRDLELLLQTCGYAGIVDVNGSLYALYGGRGGEPNPYYMPTIYTVANPALKLSKTYDIGKNVVVIPNDSMYVGLVPMFSRYASLMVENDISIRLAAINSRMTVLLSSPDDRTRQSAIEYLKNIEDGKLGVISDSAFLDSIKAQPGATQAFSNIMQELIELQQYLKASWYNELGLQSNYNMKRESINADEAAMNEDTLLPFIDDMLKCRKEGVQAVNDMFGTSITVSLASAWEDNQQELEMAHEEEEGGAEDEAGTDS